MRSRRVREAILAACALSVVSLGQNAARTPIVVERLDGRKLTLREIDRTIYDLMDGARVTGLGIALVRDGRVVLQRSYGFRDAGKHYPLNPASVMYSASLTKAAFGYMVMQLVDEKIVDLDRPISQYLPMKLPAYNYYRDLASDSRWNRITPRILLSHTAGFPNSRGLNTDGKLDIKFDPGTRYAYSAEGINLMQFVLENGFGLNTGDEMQKRVFKRFGMNKTEMTWRADFADDLAVGHDEQGKVLGHPKRTRVSASGSMDTTVEDYALFLAGLARGDGLSAAGFKEMTRPQIAIHSLREFPTLLTTTTQDNDGIGLAYGIGWGVYDSPFGRAAFKEGNDAGWNHYAIWFPERNSALLLMSNSSNAESIFKPLADELLGNVCMPWFWHGYIPYNRPGERTATAWRKPHPPCGG